MPEMFHPCGINNGRGVLFQIGDRCRWPMAARLRQPGKYLPLPPSAPLAYHRANMNVIARPSHLREKEVLMSASEIERTLVRLAHEVVEKLNGIESLGLVGIRRRGIPIAERLARHIERIEKTPVPVGTLDITLYRDDLSTVGPKPVVEPRPIGFNVAGKDIVLCDDVLYTGRTVRAALDALFDQGRPRSVKLLALIDRGHRELPIEASFVGRRVQTTEQQIIEVKLTETDQMEKVLLVEQVPETRS